MKRWPKSAATRRFELSADYLHAVIIEGAVDRVRQKMMTVVAIMAGLLLITWSVGAGSEAVHRIAASMIGGMASSVALTLIVIQAFYPWLKSRQLSRAGTPSRLVSS